MFGLGVFWDYLNEPQRSDIIYGGADTYTLAARVKKDMLLLALEKVGVANLF